MPRTKCATISTSGSGRLLLGPGDTITLYAAWNPQFGLDWCENAPIGGEECGALGAVLYESEGAAMQALVTKGWSDGGRIFPVTVTVPAPCALCGLVPGAKEVAQ